MYSPYTLADFANVPGTMKCSWNILNVLSKCQFLKIKELEWPGSRGNWQLCGTMENILANIKS